MLQAWRSATVRALGKSIHKDCVQKAISVKADSMAAKLRPYTEKKKIFKRDSGGSGEESLEDIIDNAVQLDYRLSQQKAYFFFESTSVRKNRYMPYDPESMDSGGDLGQLSQQDMQRLVIDLIHAPSLFKRGSGEGGMWDRVVNIVKADVVVTEKGPEGELRTE